VADDGVAGDGVADDGVADDGVTDADTTDPGTVVIRVVSDPFAGRGAGIRSGGSGGGVTAADVVRVRPGAGALVSPSGSGGVSAVFLITDQGARFALASRETVAALGFGDEVRPTSIPPAVLALLPDGPTLDPGLLVDAPDPADDPRERTPADDADLAVLRSTG
jgi:hypothetical protein